MPDIKGFFSDLWSQAGDNGFLRLIKSPHPVAADVLVVIFVLITILFSSTIFLAKDRFDDKPVKILIPEKSSANDIARILDEGGVLQSRLLFRATVRMLGVGPKLKAGTYFFTPAMSNLSMLNALITGRVTWGRKKVVFPEGSSIYRMARTLEKRGITVNGGSFDALDTAGINSVMRVEYSFLTDVPGDSLEGYLFPDTYFLPGNIERDVLVRLLLKRFEEVVMPVYWNSGVKKYSLHQILTMASIIEKEAEVDSERPIIASVFYNRLESGMLLRADPTVKYALQSPTKRVMFRDLRVDSPYNTYKYPGLPPGPICNPGIKSIHAALHPASTNYFYFVSNGDGTHTFSETWGGHSKAAERYRRNR